MILPQQIVDFQDRNFPDFEILMRCGKYFVKILLNP